MRKFFLPVAAILALVGGANAQTLSDRLAGAKPKLEVKPAPKADPVLPSPFKSPFARPAAEPALKLEIGKGSELLKGLERDPFWELPKTQPAFPLPKLSMPESFDPDRRPVGPGTEILRRSLLTKPANPLLEPSADFLRDFGKTLPPVAFVRPMDATKFPAERRWVLGLKGSFPKLGTDFEVQGTGTPDPDTCAARAGTRQAIPGTYNCIAHTAGIKNVWVNPYQKSEGWDDYYRPLGYKRATGTDTSFVKGVQKVAVYYGRGNDGKPAYLHAAIQEAEGTWTSKLGSGPLIRHRTAEAVAGGTYGEVVRVYERTR